MAPVQDMVTHIFNMLTLYRPRLYCSNTHIFFLSMFSSPTILITLTPILIMFLEFRPQDNPKRSTFILFASLLFTQDLAVVNPLHLSRLTVLRESR